MDNKPLEIIAEDFIKLRLAKAGLKYLKPNYDTDGTDLVVLHPINKHYARQVVVQSKGRNLTNSPSNVHINKDYVVSNFVCFLYLQVDGDPLDYAYVFFSDDIQKWPERDGSYHLSIPKGFKKNTYFVAHEFSASTDVQKIEKLLNTGPMFRQSYVEFEKMELVEILFELWKKYQSFPDPNLVKVLYDEDFPGTGSNSQDLFLVFLFGMNSEKLGHRTLDAYMQHLLNMRNIDIPISCATKIKNPNEITRMRSIHAIVYPRLSFGEIELNYDGVDYRALYSKIGDNEDYVEAALFDNGDYVVYGQRK